MQLSARGAQKTRNESRKLTMYSKQWVAGDTLRVFFPIFWQDGKPELCVGALYGHSVSDIKGLGLKTAFIPSQTTFDDGGTPIGEPDVTYQFSLIARAFVDGQKALEEAAIQAKNWPNESMLKEALRDLENRYDAKNNMEAVKPIIGRVQYYISTEVVSVKLINNQPSSETVALTSMPLSNEKIDKIYSIMWDTKYMPEEGSDYFEVEFKYPVNTSKGLSGKSSTISGLTPEYRFATQYPDAFKDIEARMSGISRDSESIVKRATRQVDPNRVLAKLKNYTIMHCDALDVADEETAEMLCKNCLILKELDAVRVLQNNELVDKLKDALSEYDAKRGTQSVEPPVPDLTETSEKSTAAPVSNEAEHKDIPIPDLSLQVGAPTVQLLMQGNTMTEDQLADVDLDIV